MIETKINIDREYIITDEDINDIMCSAFEGGINYWCSRVEIIGEPMGDCASEHIMNGGSVFLYDAEDNNKSYFFNKDMLINGIKISIAENYFAQYNWYDDENCMIDCTLIDNEVSDVIVQNGVFGEVIYN